MYVCDDPDSKQVHHTLQSNRLVVDHPEGAGFLLLHLQVELEQSPFGVVPTEKVDVNAMGHEESSEGFQPGVPLVLATFPAPYVQHDATILPLLLNDEVPAAGQADAVEGGFLLDVAHRLPGWHGSLHPHMDLVHPDRYLEVGAVVGHLRVLEEEVALLLDVQEPCLPLLVDPDLLVQGAAQSIPPILPRAHLFGKGQHDGTLLAVVEVEAILLDEALLLSGYRRKQVHLDHLHVL
mmetsp:Transcript_94346/g.243642  ORF Transcript_94346/g.243642 Transcript_94346/m.243642 type:complete len:236 (-) Transcript_94346:330-1037(-)